MAGYFDEQVSCLARTLLQARHAAGVTQEELAGLSGVSVRTISDLETGRVLRPRHATIRCLARALRINQEETRSLNLMARAAFAHRANPGGSARSGLARKKSRTPVTVRSQS